MLREGLGVLANPLILILLVAALVSGFLGEPLDAGITILVVLLSVALDFFQVFRSEQAANHLKSLVALTTTVLRDGRQTEIADGRQTEITVRDVVPGDVLKLRAGDLVPADATRLSPEPVTVDEAALHNPSWNDPQQLQLAARIERVESAISRLMALRRASYLFLLTQASTHNPQPVRDHSYSFPARRGCRR